MAKMNTLADLLTDELKDLYSAENQLIKAIPKMQKGSPDAELADAFASHLKETQQQVTRLEEIGEILGIKLTGKKCKGMEGLIEEGSEVLEEEGADAVLAVAITGAASRVEHYETAGYMAAISLAELTGEKDVARLLNESLEEELAADETMRQIGQRLGKQASSNRTGDEDTTRGEQSGRQPKTRAARGR